MRLAVHTDFDYQRVGEEIRGVHAFTLFFVELASRLDRVVLLGRPIPVRGRGRYALGPRIEFVPLPFYESLLDLRRFLPGVLGSLKRFWRVLDQVDAVWLLGPHPIQFGFAAMAAVRRRRVVLAVRQDFPAYVASRHPGRRSLRIAALAFEFAWRALARFCPTVVIGPDLAHRYRHARRLIEVNASLVSETEIVSANVALKRSYDGSSLTALSVGRLETEKNPLILADLLERLREGSRDWRLVVCGEGPFEQPLAERLAELGLDGHAELRGYVPYGSELQSLYRSSHVFAHASWTEGLPQVLLEAFAAGLPVVATDVGGVKQAVGDAAVLVPPGSAEALAAAIEEVAGDGDLRRRLITAGHSYIRPRTIDVESRRVAEFIAAD